MPTWIRVRDRDTGHEYDLHEDDPRLGGDVVEVLKDYPANSSSTAQPRAPKHRVDLAGQPVTPPGTGEQEPPAGEPPPDEPPLDGQTPPADEPPGDDSAADKTTAGTSAKKRRSN